MTRFQFTEDEYNKLSTVTGIPAIDLQKLDALGLLVNSVAVKLVFEHEYRRYRRRCIKSSAYLPTSSDSQQIRYAR